MTEYISKEAAVDAGYLSDWYIASVGDESPVWSDAHIDELLNDFIVIPKDTPTADVQPEKRGKWKHIAGMNSKCSVCSHYFPVTEFDSRPFDINFCPNCGARMIKDGDTE